MATIEFVTYSGTVDCARTNDYIADGHGNEVMRTNRYISGDHACGTPCKGVNCPSDPSLATELMETLRAKYEDNLCGRNVKGAANGSGVTHAQIIISHADDECVPPDERMKMAEELIRKTRLNDYACLIDCHNNTDHDHLHMSTCVYSLDGTRKLCINNKLIYDLRREYDRICYEHGYSIVQSPELWGDKDYKDWFFKIRDEGKVIIHPQRDKKSGRKKTKKEKYKDAKKDELTKSIRNPRRTDDNQATDFYSLPHIYDPDKKTEPLYIYAIDKNGDRKSPLQLDLSLQFEFASRCLKKLDKMRDFEGKESIQLRMQWAMDNAYSAYEMVSTLDIGSRDELFSYLKNIGNDLSKYRMEFAYQSKIIDENKENGNTEKIQKALARKNKAAQKIDRLKSEYRGLKHTEAVLENLDTAEHWAIFKRELIEQGLKKQRTTEDTIDLIFTSVSDLGRMMGLTQDEIDGIFGGSKPENPSRIKAIWESIRGRVRVTFTQRTTGISEMYEMIKEDYLERQIVRNEINNLEDSVPLVGPITLILKMMLYIIYILPYEEEQRRIEEQIAETKRLIEEIQYHNKMAKKEMIRARHKLGLALIKGEYEAIERAWVRFEVVCDMIIEQSEYLQEQEASSLSSVDYSSSVISIDNQIEKINNLRDGNPATLADYLLRDNKSWKKAKERNRMKRMGIKEDPVTRMRISVDKIANALR